MTDQQAQRLFDTCKPLIKKLGVQEYDYQFDPADLATLPAWDQLLECLSACGDLGDLAGSVEAGDVYEYELFWYRAFSEMREILQKRASEPTEEPYYPFRQRLDALERLIQYLLATGILHYRDDHEVLLVAEAAQENPCYLSLAEKMLAEIQAEVGGEQASRWQRQDWILLYELRLQILRFGALIICPSDYRKPSTVIREEWLIARKRGYVFDERRWKIEKGGAWLLFASSKEVDMIWQKIARATTEGWLGLAAKVSTGKPRKIPHHHDFVLYIYTQGVPNDEAQLRAQLRALGIMHEIQYQRAHIATSKATSHA